MMVSAAQVVDHLRKGDVVTRRLGRTRLTAMHDPKQGRYVLLLSGEGRIRRFSYRTAIETADNLMGGHRKIQASIVSRPRLATENPMEWGWIVAVGLGGYLLAKLAYNQGVTAGTTQAKATTPSVTLTPGGVATNTSRLDRGKHVPNARARARS